MNTPRSQRRLAAILAADVVGYSKLMGQDEAGTLAALKALRAEVFDPKVTEHSGRIFKSTGDGCLAEFPSVVNAVACAVSIQKAMPEHSTNHDIQLRIGINVGDVVVEDGDVFGDGVNVAARVEGIAPPGGIALTETARDHLGSRLKLDFTDTGTHSLKNIERPIRVFVTGGVDSSTRTSDTKGTDRPSIAVLPFENMSGDPEQTYFSDGVTEDIITELSRFRSLFVIARNSSFALRNEQPDIAEIGRRLGVQFVVEGSVRRAGNRVRITAQLINVATGAHVWAERYDRQLEDIFDIQDEVVRTIVATVAGRLEVAGAEYAKHKPPESLLAYDYVLRGLEQLSLEGEEHNLEALHLFQKAVELDPQYATGHAYLALAIFVQWSITRSPGELERALPIARRALMLDESDSRCHRVLATIYLHLRQYDLAELHSNKSVALNSNDPLSAINRSGVLRYCGRADEGVALARRAIQINPYHPNWYWNHLALTLHAAGRYGEALTAYSQIAQRPIFYGHPYHAYVAGCHAELGQMGEARAHAALTLQTIPDFSVAACRKKLPFKKETDLQHFLDGLRKAGLPE